MNEQTYDTKFQNVINELLRRIANGEFASNGRIPSENEISKTYGVSVITSRRALNDLVASGQIVRIKGKGSFLADSVSAATQQETPPTNRGVVSLILISYEESDLSFMSIIRGANKALLESGYSLTIECSNRNSQTESEILKRCLRDKVSGVLILSVDPMLNRQELIALERAEIPFVLLDRDLKDYPCTMISSYNFSGMFQMTEYLIRNGHKQIAYLANEKVTSVHEERQSGYQSAMRQNGLVPSEDFCLTSEASQLHMIPSLIRNKGVTAVVCVNDVTAYNLVTYLRENNIRVPEDVSVTGVDNGELSQRLDLTTMQQHFYEMGSLAAQKLLDLREGKTGHSHTLLPVDLIIRSSTKAL